MMHAFPFSLISNRFQPIIQVFVAVKSTRMKGAVPLLSSFPRSCSSFFWTVVNLAKNYGIYNFVDGVQQNKLKIAPEFVSPISSSRLLDRRILEYKLIDELSPEPYLHQCIARVVPWNKHDAGSSTRRFNDPAGFKPELTNAWVRSTRNKIRTHSALQNQYLITENKMYHY